MRKLLGATAMLGMVAAGAGCLNPSIARPDFLHPGSLAYQRWRAEVFDPYPQNDIGTPVEGGRPPQFHTSAPLPQRAGQTQSNVYNRFGPPPDKYSLEDVP